MRGSMAVVLAVSAVLAIRSAAHAADDLLATIAKLTGLDTAQSLAVDQEVEKLLAKHAEVKARWLALDAGPTKGALLAEVSDLEKQALARAFDAATLRANAANDELCERVADSAPASQTGPTSPYLCSAVADAQPGDQTNDPWVVCACAKQYVRGLRAEVAAIRQRAKAFIGMRRPLSVDVGLGFHDPRSEPLSAEAEAELFDWELNHGGDTVGESGGWTFVGLAEVAQKRLAQLKVYQQTTDVADLAKSYFATPQDRVTAFLRPAERVAYFNVQAILRQAWRLYQEEGAFQMAAIEESIVDEIEPAEKSFRDRVGAAYRSADDQTDLSWDERYQLIREAEQKMCPDWVAGQMPFIEQAIGAARGVAAAVYDVRRRLLADAEAWKAFGLKDGAGTGPEAGIEFLDEDFSQFIAETLALDPNIYGRENRNAGKLETGWTFWLPSAVSQDDLGPWCSWPGYFLDDPLADYWHVESSDYMWADSSYGYWTPGNDTEAYNERLLRAAQARFPEVEEISGTAWLRFSLDAKGQVSEAVVSGAAPGEEP